MGVLMQTSLGFTFIELLVSLFLVSLLALGIAHFQLVSQAVQVKMQQETLASALLDKLLVQAEVSASKSLSLERLADQTCANSHSATSADWCLALNKLPSLRVIQGSQEVSLEWQTPKGTAKISRPNWVN